MNDKRLRPLETNESIGNYYSIHRNGKLLLYTSQKLKCSLLLFFLVLACAKGYQRDWFIVCANIQLAIENTEEKRITKLM